mmetsp:Transcript_126505/g.178553  ORF Transcript_126505/g.178553 Transcript_126505/m.178553 type:complete len:142 (+) Transcript_126505:106-531(+)
MEFQTYNSNNNTSPIQSLDSPYSEASTNFSENLSESGASYEVNVSNGFTSSTNSPLSVKSLRKLESLVVKHNRDWKKIAKVFEGHVDDGKKKFTPSELKKIYTKISSKKSITTSSAKFTMAEGVELSSKYESKVLSNSSSN